MLAVVFLAQAASAQTFRHGAGRVPHGSLLVSGYTSETIHRYWNGSGAPAGTFGAGAVPGAQKIVRGPDRLLYVCAEEASSILRFRDDGTFVDAFVSDDPMTPADETGGLVAPTGADFGPDGDLYVGDFAGDDVLRYDGGTGAFVEVFVTAGSGGLNGPDAGLVFAPNGDLLVPSFFSDDVLRYSGVDGTHLGSFDGGALSRPRDILIDGNDVFVSSWGNNRVLRYDLAGDFQELFFSTNRPTGLAKDPWEGDIFVTTDANDRVRRHDGVTGALEGVFVLPGAGGLDGGTYLFWLEGPR